MPTPVSATSTGDEPVREADGPDDGTMTTQADPESGPNLTGLLVGALLVLAAVAAFFWVRTRRRAAA